LKKKWEIWVKRPVLWFLFAYGAGIAFSIYLPIKPVYLLLPMTAIAAAGFFFRKKALFPALLIFLILFGMLRGSVFHYRENPLIKFVDKEITLRGIVKGAPQADENRVLYIVETVFVKTGDQIYPVKAKIRVSVYPDSYDEKAKVLKVYQTGDLVEATGTLKEPNGPRNPKGFDYKTYLKRRGIYSIISVKEKNIDLVRQVKGLSLDRLLALFRDKASKVLENTVGGREGNFLKAVLLGQRWLIEPESEDAFTKTGLAHILAISGLHIGFLVVLLKSLQSVLKLQRGRAFMLQSIILILYCLMTGASPSVTRAVIMSLIYLGGRALGRKSDIINSAGTAAFIILLIRPMDIQEISFQLSFISVCSIALLSDPIQKALKFLPKQVSALIAASMAAQSGTLPLTAYYFNIFSPVSVFANLLAVPLLGIVGAGGFLIVLLGMCFLPAAAALAVPIRFLCGLIFSITDFAANLPYAYIRVVSPSLFSIAAAYMILWMLSRERPSFIRKPALVSMCLAAVLLAGNLLAGYLEPKELEIVFLDVGQGDCAFIQTPDGKNILIDGGSQEGEDIGEKVLLPFLLKNGISSLDLVVMSHVHEDHISGLPNVLDQLRVKAFMEYPPTELNAAYLELKDIIKKKNIKVIAASGGKSYRIGNETWIHVLYPDEDAAPMLYQGNENNLSLVLLLECGDASVLFTGDIEKEAENYLAGRMKKQASVLKVPHHGSSTSSTEAFLDAVSPDMAVIQAGNNLFGHPAPQTLERLDARNISIYRNDLHGAVIMNYKDEGWSIHVMNSND